MTPKINHRIETDLLAAMNKLKAAGTPCQADPAGAPGLANQAGRF